MVDIEDFLVSKLFYDGLRNLIHRGYRLKGMSSILNDDSGLFWEMIITFRLEDGGIVEAVIFEKGPKAMERVDELTKLDNAELKINISEDFKETLKNKKLVSLLEKWLKDDCGADYEGPIRNVPKSAFIPDSPIHGIDAP
jgi:hypothetical protein